MVTPRRFNGLQSPLWNPYKSVLEQVLTNTVRTNEQQTTSLILEKVKRNGGPSSWFGQGEKLK